MFIFLAIAVGFAAGVQEVTIALMLSIIFNFILVLIWRYDFGRNVLEPTAAVGMGRAAERSRRRKTRAATRCPTAISCSRSRRRRSRRSPQRFDRVRALLGPNGKKPRYNAVVTIDDDRHLPRRKSTSSRRSTK